MLKVFAIILLLLYSKCIDAVCVKSYGLATSAPPPSFADFAAMFKITDAAELVIRLSFYF